jgi:hypothetical protein
MATMTVFFDDPYWVGVLELPQDGRLHAVRHVFGGEPTDAELYQYLVVHGVALLRRAERAAPVPDDQPAAVRVGNPKRLARQAARAAQPARPSTAAQEAVRHDLEQRGREAAQRAGARRAAHDEHRRTVRRAKARERRRGH